MQFLNRLTHLARRKAIRISTVPATAPRWHSVSSTREYETCPRRYWFGYVARVPEPPSAVPADWRFGTVVHAGLEAGYRQHQAVGHSRNLSHAIPVAIEAVRRSWHEEEMDSDVEGLVRAETVVRASLATTSVWPREILGVEQYFRATTVEGLRVAGAVDLVIRTSDSTVEIRDHKVTRSTRGIDELVSDLQLNLYGWLVRQTWPWASTVFVSHHYPLLREVVRVELRDREVAAALERVRSVGVKAEADKRFDPQPGEHCRECSYRHSCDVAFVAA